MSETLGDDGLQRLASLARLVLTDGERQRYAADMRRILGYVDKLHACDTKDVAPTSHAGVTGTWRDDEAQEGLSLDDALKNAPERIGDGFGVPKIIE